MAQKLQSALQYEKHLFFVGLISRNQGGERHCSIFLSTHKKNADNHCRTTVSENQDSEKLPFFGLKAKPELKMGSTLDFIEHPILHAYTEAGSAFKLFSIETLRTLIPGSGLFCGNPIDTRDSVIGQGSNQP